MIQAYAAELAAQMGIKLSHVSVIDGKRLGCRDSHLLQLYAGGRREGALIYQTELDDLQKGIRRAGFETRIRAALSRLNILLKPE